MAQIINFPKKIRYSIYGLARDGKIIVDIINSSKRFTMYAENIVANTQLIDKFPKRQVQWLYDVVESNSGVYQTNGFPLVD